jgi:hypothetical protein
MNEASALVVSRLMTHSPSRERSIFSPGAATLLAQHWKKAFRCLRQKPRQRHFDAQRDEHAHPEAQSISFPSLLLRRDHRSEVTVGAGEALFETADSLDLPEMMADDDSNGITHGNCNCIACTCMRTIMIERRSQLGLKTLLLLLTKGASTGSVGRFRLSVQK